MLFRSVTGRRPRLRASGRPLTDEAEDVPDGRDEDDQHVVEGQDGGGDQHVASPAELSAAEQQRRDGGADLAGPQEQGGYRLFPQSFIYTTHISTGFHYSQFY